MEITAYAPKLIWVCANDAGALQGAAFCVQTRETCWPDLTFIDIDDVAARA